MAEDNSSAEPKPKNKGGRPRLSIEEKTRRGTLQPWRERARQEKERGEQGLKIDPDPEAQQDYIAVMMRYMAAVESGAIVSNKWLKLAVARQRRDMLRSDWEFVFSPFFAIKTCAFIEQLPHVEGGPWKSPNVQLEPWQVFIVCVFFGWRHRETPGRRRFSTLYLEIGRKGGKTTLMAAFALYHLLREEELGAQVICGATTGTQARTVFDIARKMIQRSRWLVAQGCSAMQNSILVNDGRMKPINARASSQDGLNPSCIILDEAHAQDAELYNVLTSAQGSRSNPMLLMPTSAGYGLLSVGYSMHTQLRKILTEVFTTDHFFGIIYGIDEGDEWTDERVWSKANPGLGIAPLLFRFRNDFIEATQNPTKEPEFRIKNLCEWLNSSSTWLHMPSWDACADPSCMLEKFVGRECCIGIDLSQGDDIAAAAYTFLIDGILWACVDLYLPEDVVIEKAQKIPELRYWVKAGILKLTPGTAIDTNRVEADVRANCHRFKIRDISADHVGSQQMIISLFNSGLPAHIEYKNARTYTAPSRDLEMRVKSRRFRHAGNSALRWQASNVVVERRVDGSILPKKENAMSQNKIDGIDAIIRSISGWLRDSGGGSKQFQAFVLGG